MPGNLPRPAFPKLSVTVHTQTSGAFTFLQSTWERQSLQSKEGARPVRALLRPKQANKNLCAVALGMVKCPAQGSVGSNTLRVTALPATRYFVSVTF